MTPVDLELKKDNLNELEYAFKLATKEESIHIS